MIKKSLFKSTIAILLIGSMSLSCASIFKGSSADVRVNSNPAGASIFINGMDKGETPQTLSLSRNQNHILTFKKDGYEDVVVEVSKKFDVGTALIGNIFSWGVLGLVVDVATGAAYSLTPADVQANMESMQQAGIIDANANLGENDVFVFMLTSDQWAEIQAANK